MCEEKGREGEREREINGMRPTYYIWELRKMISIPFPNLISYNSPTRNLKYSIKQIIELKYSKTIYALRALVVMISQM